MDDLGLRSSVWRLLPSPHPSGQTAESEGLKRHKLGEFLGVQENVCSCKQKGPVRLVGGQAPEIASGLISATVSAVARPSKPKTAWADNNGLSNCRGEALTALAPLGSILVRYASDKGEILNV